MKYHKNCKMVCNYIGDEYGTFTYIAFLVNDKEQWRSGYYESGDSESMEELREEVKERLELWDCSGNTDSDSPEEWDFV